MEKRLIKDVVLIPTLTAILFVQQIALSFIPNVQLTTLLILIYTKVIGFRKTSIIIVLHVIAYNLLSPYGPTLLIDIPFIVIAWMLFSLIVKLVKDNIYLLSFIGLFFGFVYGWILIIPAVIIMQSPFLPYLISDIPFEIIMAISNFVTILWLYDRLKPVLEDLIKNFYSKNNDSV